MAATRVFRAGNSQAVRIPRALAFDTSVKEVDIERRGDSLVITPQKPGMTALVDFLRTTPRTAPPMTRLPIDWPIRSFDPDAER